MFILAHFATELPDRRRATTARKGQFYCVDAFGRPRYGLSANTIHNHLRKKVKIPSVRTALKRPDNDETSQACLGAMVSTGTGFRSVAKCNLHSAMLMVKQVYWVVGMGDGAELLPVPGRPATFACSRARTCCACSRCGTGWLYFFIFFIYLPFLIGRPLNMTEIVWFRLLNPNSSCQLLPRTSSLSTG